MRLVRHRRWQGPQLAVVNHRRFHAPVRHLAAHGKGPDALEAGQFQDPPHGHVVLERVRVDAHVAHEAGELQDHLHAEVPEPLPPLLPLHDDVAVRHRALTPEVLAVQDHEGGDRLASRVADSENLAVPALHFLEEVLLRGELVHAVAVAVEGGVLYHVVHLGHVGPRHHVDGDASAVGQRGVERQPHGRAGDAAAAAAGGGGGGVGAGGGAACGRRAVGAVKVNDGGDVVGGGGGVVGGGGGGGATLSSDLHHPLETGTVGGEDS